VEIETTRFGHVEIDEKLIITLPQGILGFEDFKRYCILDHIDKESPFKWLQSVDDPSLAFVITDPLIFLSHYKAKVPVQEVADIKLSDAAQAIIAVIVNIKRDHSEITMNLQGPLVINSHERLAKQVIIRDGEYSVRHVIFSATAKECSTAQSPASEHGEAIKPNCL